MTNSRRATLGKAEGENCALMGKEKKGEKDCRFIANAQSSDDLSRLERCSVNVRIAGRSRRACEPSGEISDCLVALEIPRGDSPRARSGKEIR